MSRATPLRALAGIAGPVVFTGAWAVSSLRQQGYSIVEEHISGLAAPDAHQPHVMTAGFLALGACTTAFAGALEQALGGRGEAGVTPWFVRAGGLGLLAAGLLRRDRMLLRPPGEVVDHQSWRNDGHDIASAVVYAAVVAAPLSFARRVRDDPRWRPLSTPAYATAGLAAVLLAAYAFRVVEPYNGVVQRVAVTVPGAAMAALAARLLRRRAVVHA